MFFCHETAIKEEFRWNTSLMTQTETDDKEMENLKDQLDVLLYLPQELDHYNTQYFNQYFTKHFRPWVSVNTKRKDYVT